jgi:uncharacterized membrane protein
LTEHSEHLHGAPPKSRSSSVTQSLSVRINCLLRFVAKHWLLLANVGTGLQALAPILPPFLMVSGHTGLAHLLYRLFQPLCHQLPERSFFLFGPQFSYTFEELSRLVPGDVPLRYVGNAAIGYKTAVCQRDVATYLALFLASLAFGTIRRRARPLRLTGFVLMALPMAIDGSAQLLGLWQSTWWSRTFSGTAFGVACVWLAFPQIEVAMHEVERLAEVSAQDE